MTIATVDKVKRESNRPDPRTSLMTVLRVFISLTEKKKAPPIKAGRMERKKTSLTLFWKGKGYVLQGDDRMPRQAYPWRAGSRNLILDAFEIPIGKVMHPVLENEALARAVYETYPKHVTPTSCRDQKGFKIAERV